MNGNFEIPLIMSDTETDLTTVSSNAFTNEQIWHLGESKGGALRDSKSEQRLRKPGMHPSLNVIVMDCQILGSCGGSTTVFV